MMLYEGMCWSVDVHHGEWCFHVYDSEGMRVVHSQKANIYVFDCCYMTLLYDFYILKKKKVTCKVTLN